jgi:hypothetical protein
LQSAIRKEFQPGNAQKENSSLQRYSREDRLVGKISEPSFGMANEKFSMTNSQFRLSRLTAALQLPHPAPLHPKSFRSRMIAATGGGTAASQAGSPARIFARTSRDRMGSAFSS